MARLVTEQHRAKAVELSAQLVKHQMDRVRDSLNRAAELLEASSVSNPDDAIAEINRAANIAGRAQQAAQIWKGLVIDERKNNPSLQQGAPLSEES